MTSSLALKLDAKDLDRLGNLIGAAGKRAPVALARAINHSGDKARTRMIRALAGQTGLKVGTTKRALRTTKAGAGGLTYVIRSRGGDIRLKYFGARETRRGVSAAPWNKRSIYPHTFLKAGWWPRRVVKPSWNGQVFERMGSKTKTGMDRFETVRSGLLIPDEMVKGASADAFYSAVDQDLAARLAHELLQVIGGR